MEIPVHGPDGATHLILCTGIAELGFVGHETFTFWVGPKLSRRQFVGAIASGALAAIESRGQNENATMELGASVVSIVADYDDKCGQVKVTAEMVSHKAKTKLALSYTVSILAELPTE